MASPAFLETLGQRIRRGRHCSPSCAHRFGTRPKRGRAAFEKLGQDVWATAPCLSSCRSLLPGPGTTSASSWPPTWRIISARWSSAAASFSQQLRDFLAEGGKYKPLRYLAARDNAKRYAAGLNESSSSMMRSSRRPRQASRPRARPPAIRPSIRCGRSTGAAGGVIAVDQRRGRHAARCAARRPHRRRCTAAAHGELVDQQACLIRPVAARRGFP